MNATVDYFSTRTPNGGIYSWLAVNTFLAVSPLNSRVVVFRHLYLSALPLPWRCEVTSTCMRVLRRASDHLGQNCPPQSAPLTEKRTLGSNSIKYIFPALCSMWNECSGHEYQPSLECRRETTLAAGLRSCMDGLTTNVTGSRGLRTIRLAALRDCCRSGTWRSKSTIHGTRQEMPNVMK